MFIVCIHYSIFWLFFKIFSFIFLKLILRMYLLRRLSAPQAKKFGFFTHFKGFSIHFSCNANFGTERPVSSFRRSTSFRSSQNWNRSVLEEERERRTERNDAEQERENTDIDIYMLYPICSFIRFAHWAKRMSDLLIKQIGYPICSVDFLMSKSDVRYAHYKLVRCLTL